MCGSLGQNPFFHQTENTKAEATSHISCPFLSSCFFLTRWGAMATLCIYCAVWEEVSVFFRACVRSSSTHMKLSEDFVVCSHSNLK